MMENKQRDTTAKFYFDLGVAKAIAHKKAIRIAENEYSRLLQAQLADELEIRWYIV